MPPLRWRVCDADWNHRSPGLSDREVWSAAASAGADGVALGVRRAEADLSTDRLAGLAALRAEHRLPVGGLTLVLSADQWPEGALGAEAHVVERVAAEIDACARRARSLRIATIGLVSPADPPGSPFRFAEGLARMRDVAAHHGVRLALGYLPGSTVSTVDDSLEMAIRAPGTGVLLNTGSATGAGEDPADSLRRLAQFDLLWDLQLDGIGEDVFLAMHEVDFRGVVTVDSGGLVGRSSGEPAGALVRRIRDESLLGTDAGSNW